MCIPSSTYLLQGLGAMEVSIDRVDFCRRAAVPVAPVHGAVVEPATVLLSDLYSPKAQN